MKNIEPIFKWLCILLSALVLYLGAYNWRDTRYEAEVARTQTLAAALSQINNLLSDDQANVIHQVNRILINTGYSNLVRRLDNENKD